MSESPHVLEAEGLEFAYAGGEPVLRGVDLATPAERFVCVLGPNGSGKTTLLRCLLGQLAPSRGSIHLDGRPLGAYSPRELARQMAYVPQFPRSAFSFTVRQIVLMGRYPRMGSLGIAGAQDREVARLAMEMTDALRFADRTLEELSGGEAQCVMIARALAQQPSVTLLDEPTSHLDIRNQLSIYRMMRRLADDWKMAVVCVSHDVNLAARFADRLVLMRDGRVAASGSPAEVVRPEVLSEVYGVEIESIPVPGRDAPVVLAR